MIPPTPWVRSFCPLSLLYPSVSDFQFRYTPVTVGKGRAAWFSLRSASSLSFGRGEKAAESGDVDYEYHHITKLIADLLLLFGLCIKETDKLIKISKNVIQLRITLLNYNGYVIINFFISKNRNLDTKTISFIEFVKPSGKKASSHSLSAILS